MLTQGVRGDELPQEEEIAEADLELYGVDWEGLGDDQILQSNEENNMEEPGVIQQAEQFVQPQHLNRVSLESPDHPFSDDQVVWLSGQLAQYQDMQNREHVLQAWGDGLVYARMLDPDRF